MSMQAAPDACARRAGSLTGAASSLSAVLILAFLPKCPVCVAVWLGAVGLGASSAALAAPLLRPAAYALGAASALLLGWSAWRARKPQNRGLNS